MRVFFFSRCASTRHAVIGEHVTRKSQHLGLRISPGFPRQQRFPASLVQKLLASKTVLDSHLWKQ